MAVEDFERVPLLFGPSPVHRLERLSEHLGGRVEIWAKRDDCNSGLAFGNGQMAGPKTTLFFAAGPHKWRGASELAVHGLLGAIRYAP